MPSTKHKRKQIVTSYSFRGCKEKIFWGTGLLKH